jgi:hypothetical protein
MRIIKIKMNSSLKKYVLLLVNKNDSSLYSSPIMVFASSDEEANKKVYDGLHGTDVFYDPSGKTYADSTWIVHTLVNLEGEKNVYSQTGGSVKTLKKITKQKVKIGGTEKSVYVGPRGGRYVKGKSGTFLRI